jgi:hypothetical protein
VHWADGFRLSNAVPQLHVVQKPTLCGTFIADTFSRACSLGKQQEAQKIKKTLNVKLSTHILKFQKGRHKPCWFRPVNLAHPLARWFFLYQHYAQFHQAFARRRSGAQRSWQDFRPVVV